LQALHDDLDRLHHPAVCDVIFWDLAPTFCCIFSSLPYTVSTSMLRWEPLACTA
jgi:hypothetical protein